jgi:hypothetical protein
MQPPLSQAEGKLPNVRIVGFSGHRHINHPEAVAAALKNELGALQNSGCELIAISSIAIGADTLFARAVLHAGIKWVVVLPMPRELFREDFTPENWAEAERLMAQASEVRILRGTERPQVYVDVGKATVDDADYLMAVWDGKPAQGPGGTAEIVAYAKMLGREIILLRENETGVEKGDLAPVPTAKSSPEELLQAMGPYTQLPPPPQILLDHFKACDEEATRTAPNVRRNTLRMAGCHLAATLVGGLSLSLHAHQFSVSWLLILIGMVKVAFVGAALWIMFLLWNTHRHATWLRHRREAEYGRSILATWHCLTFIEPDSFHEVPELMNLARSALFLRLEKSREAVVDLASFRAAYARERVLDQWKYFQNEGDKAEAKVGPLRVEYLLFTLLAFAASAILLALQIGNSPLVAEKAIPMSLFNDAFRHFLEIAPLAFPALASFTITRLAIDEVDRRLGRFRDLQEKMRLALVDLSYCNSWDSISRCVEKTEKLLFKEVLEWYSMAMDSKT